uniref:Uncharacterized protein n=1 Tax=Timema cristinae TaxID=61476 RepID=A0A7R9CME5_TIMCR|nr:unnamed protein product [Timema cristinae]
MIEQFHENVDFNNEDLASDKETEKEREYFHTVIRPMLQSGHEGELCEWMKQMGLLRRGVRCNNPECHGVGTMKWSKARIVDKYNWSCFDCPKKVSIRDGSFFVNIKCELKAAIQAIVGWCEQTPVDVTCKHLNLKNHIVKRVYERCLDVVQNYILSHPQDWLLGGDKNSVVVVDVFPDGYMSERALGAGKKGKVLCIADTSLMPARTWCAMLHHSGQAMAGPSSRLNDSDILDYLDTIDSDSDSVYESDSDITSDDDNVPDLRNPAVLNMSDSDENDMDDEDYREILSPEQLLPIPFPFQELSGPKHMPPPDSLPIAYFLFFTDFILSLDQAGKSQSALVEEVVTHIRAHVRPNSTLVVNNKIDVLSEETLKTLTEYTSIITVETLMEHDEPGTRRIQDNLETIWASAVEVCEDIQDVRRGGPQLLYEYMWRQLFALSPSCALQYILHHIADQFPFQDY